MNTEYEKTSEGEIFVKQRFAIDNADLEDKIAKLEEAVAKLKEDRTEQVEKLRVQFTDAIDEREDELKKLKKLTQRKK